MSGDWVPVVDISRHQGRVDFVQLRKRGVKGVIIRVGHGQAVDPMFAPSWRAALDAGFTRADLAVYTFINPKRGTAVDCADAMLDAIDRVVGDTRVGYMLDVEHYAQESPNVGAAPVRGAEFAVHIRAHRDHVIARADAFVFAYAARSFWNGRTAGGEWVGDDRLAGELEWLVPRYPVHSVAGYASRPVPFDPALWDEWAFGVQPVGPLPPRGAVWSGWQFSADFNGRGRFYGAESADLDLNIIRREAWSRWTCADAQPSPGGNLMSIPHKRILDTRQAVGGRLPANADRVVFVPATIPMPEGATGVVVNIGVDRQTGPGFLTTATSDGDTAILNFHTGTESNLAVIPVTRESGMASASFAVRSSVATDLIVDMQGWAS
jgi:hypothetical protein